MHLAPSHNLKFPLKFYLPQKALIDHLLSDRSLLLPANNLHLPSLLDVFLQHLPDILVILPIYLIFIYIFKLMILYLLLYFCLSPQLERGYIHLC